LQFFDAVSGAGVTLNEAQAVFDIADDAVGDDEF